MFWDFSEMIRLFSGNDKGRLLSEGYFGIEKESQRVTCSGGLALTPHPAAFGDKAENPRITTDFSESQIEMITPPFQSVEEVYHSLKEIQLEVQENIGDELLWPLSMPPKLPEEEQIPIAKFSDSEDGKEIEAYRNGLALRYGKKMQMISGIHYNFSFSEALIDSLYEQFGMKQSKRAFIDDMYFALTRNFLRYRWVLIYLFGASPDCDETYYSVISKELEIIQKCCPDCCGGMRDFKKYAASLRVSRFGYSNALQRKYAIYYNSLEEYTRKIRKMMTTVNKKYVRLGFHKNGSRIQMNGNILQKESEFYSPIRVKQNIAKGETQLEALNKRGVKYIEVRVLDSNPFEKLSVTIEQMRFLQIFMLFCLFEKSDYITEDEFDKINSNHHMTALFGRKKDLILRDNNGGTIPLKEFGLQIFDKLCTIAELMDTTAGGERYSQSAANERRKLFDISLLPSERIQRQMQEKNESFLEFGIRQAIHNTQELKEDFNSYERV